MPRLRDPKQVARKKKVHIDEVEALVNELPRYGVLNCWRIQTLLIRLLDEAQTYEENSRVLDLVERFEAGCRAKVVNYCTQIPVRAASLCTL